MAGSRISLMRCRELLGDDSPSSDSDLEEIVKGLYFLADLSLSLLEDQKKYGAMSNENSDGPDAFFSCLQLIPSEDQEAVEERAAIREFEGEQQRDFAERSAVLDLLGKNSD